MTINWWTNRRKEGGGGGGGMRRGSKINVHQRWLSSLSLKSGWARAQPMEVGRVVFIGTSLTSALTSALPADAWRTKEMNVVVGGVMSTATERWSSWTSPLFLFSVARRLESRMVTPLGRFIDDGDTADGLSCVDTPPKKRLLVSWSVWPCTVSGRCTRLRQNFHHEPRNCHDQPWKCQLHLIHLHRLHFIIGHFIRSSRMAEWQARY